MKKGKGTNDYLLYKFHFPTKRGDEEDSSRVTSASDFVDLRPEFVDNIEFGMKSQWMDNRLQFNATYFYNDFEDKQDSSIKQDPTTLTVVTVVDNVAGVEYSGVELELKDTLLDLRFFQFLILCF